MPIIDSTIRILPLVSAILLSVTARDAGAATSPAVQGSDASTEKAGLSVPEGVALPDSTGAELTPEEQARLAKLREDRRKARQEFLDKLRNASPEEKERIRQKLLSARNSDKSSAPAPILDGDLEDTRGDASLSAQEREERRQMREELKAQRKLRRQQVQELKDELQLRQQQGNE